MWATILHSYYNIATHLLSVSLLLDVYLRNLKGDLDAKIRVCDWYRRLGWYREGYLLIIPHHWSTGIVAENDVVGKQLLWCARFLNLLGGTHFALGLARRIQCSTAQAHRVVGNIYLSAYEFDEALTHFKKAWELEQDRSSYPAKMGFLGYCDALAAKQRFDHALKNLATLHAKEEEKLLHGILLEAKGEYLAKMGKFKEAKKVLDESEKYFPEALSPNHAFQMKWLGYVEANLGNKKRAKELFTQALEIIHVPQMRAEAWLEAYWLMYKVNLLPASKVPLLVSYPGLSEVFLQREGMPSRSIKLKAVSEKSIIKISISRGEWKYRKKITLGIPKEIALIEILKRCGSDGLTLTRLKSLLWPDEVAAFFQLEQRIYQLVKRIQIQYKLSSSIKNGVLSLDSKSLERVEVELHPDLLPLSFYETNQNFAAKDFANYYGLAKTRASILLKKELEQGRIIFDSKVRRYQLARQPEF